MNATGRKPSPERELAKRELREYGVKDNQMGARGVRKRIREDIAKIRKNKALLRQ